MAVCLPDSSKRHHPSKQRLQFSLAELLSWITAVALWLSLLKWSGSWADATIVGVLALVWYCTWRFDLPFRRTYLPMTLWVIVAVCVLAGIMVLFLPSVPG